MLLMAIAAIMLMTIACGSSDDPTELPGTPRSGTDTSEPASNAESQTQSETENQQASPNNGKADSPQVVNTPQIRGAGTTPWPTSAPTRAPSNDPTPAPNAAGESDGGETPEPAHDRTEPRTTTTELTAPSYDGTSPLVHVFFDQPWIIIPSIKGQTHTPSLKGLTQEGTLVSIKDPKQWGITFDIWNQSNLDNPITTAEDGTVTVQTDEPPPYHAAEYLTAEHNGFLTQILVYHGTLDDQIITILDPNAATGSKLWSREDCAYGFPHEDTYKAAFHHASATVASSTPSALAAVYEEAMRMGYEPAFIIETDYPLSTSPVTFTHLLPPTNDCVPLEEAYQLARNINKIPGVHITQWLRLGKAFTMDHLQRLHSEERRNRN